MPPPAFFPQELKILNWLSNAGQVFPTHTRWTLGGGDNGRFPLTRAFVQVGEGGEAGKEELEVEWEFGGRVLVRIILVCPIRFFPLGRVF